ncbi:conserved hypothetical protein [Neospora caninum Liverpool]|uniref:Uncharacterized protein n=1 Tax=Neospora caninum (strain Liverpool) TaxID=572307 RepID=F0VNT6_NEOCL|nr:conserved hypothetical protein [Neospora caninum Liverpool]CBZ55382.1 conserved hypothetical protein [Neospora caninum Liverpool]|eukprot:XP_003885410.1 conserved hypothetical protein [Neospora caninum Liverpool]
MTLHVHDFRAPAGSLTAAWLVYFLFLFSLMESQARLSPLSSTLFSDLASNRGLCHFSSPSPAVGAVGASGVGSLAAAGRHAASAKCLRRLPLSSHRNPRRNPHARRLDALLKPPPQKWSDGSSDPEAPVSDTGSFCLRTVRFCLSQGPSRARNLPRRLADVSTVGSVIASPVSSPAAAASLILGVYEHVAERARRRGPELFHPGASTTTEETPRETGGLVSTACSCGSTRQTAGVSLAHLTHRECRPDVGDPERFTSDGARRGGDTGVDKEAASVEGEANWDWDAWLMREREKWLSGTHHSLLIQKKARFKGRGRRVLSDKKKWEVLFDRTSAPATTGPVEATASGTGSCAFDLKQGGSGQSPRGGNEDEVASRQGRVPGEGAQSQGYGAPLSKTGLIPTSGEGEKQPLSQGSLHLIGEGLDRQAFEERLLKSKFLWPLQPNNGAALRSIQYMPAAYELFLSVARRVRNAPGGHQEEDNEDNSEDYAGDPTHAPRQRGQQRKKRSPYERVNQFLQTSPVAPDAVDCVWRALTRVVTGPFGEVLPPRTSLSCPTLAAVSDTQGLNSGRRLYRGDFLRSIWEWAPADGFVDWESFLFFLDEVPSDGVESLFN